MAPAPAQCVQRQEIAESIRVVLKQILLLHRAELAAKGDLDKMERIDKELQKAHARETSLLEKLHAHIQLHGCQRNKVLD